MLQSIYSEFVERNFPQLVLAITETLNGRSLNSKIPFIFRDALNPTYSPDSRWQTISAKYEDIAADIVALGSPTPLKGRDSMNSYVGEIPKFGTMRSLDEVQMKDIDNMINQRRPEQEIINKIFNDTPFVINAVDEGIEDLFLSELSNGVGYKKNNIGQAVKFDMHYTDYPENHRGVSVLWAGSSAKPVNDIQKIVDQAEEDGNVIIRCYADDIALKAMYENEQVRAYFGFQQDYVGSVSNVPTLSFKQLMSLFSNTWGMELVRVRRTTRTEANGTRNKHKAWANGRMVFTCDERIGDLVYTATAEETRQAKDVSYQKANDYCLVSKFSEQEPLMEYTKSQAMVCPVLQNVNRIYSLDTLTVQA